MGGWRVTPCGSELACLRLSETEPLPYSSRFDSAKRRQMAADEKVRRATLGQLTDSQRREKAEGERATRFNRYTSDRIPITRRGRDTRINDCLEKRWEAALRPSVEALSVIDVQTRASFGPGNTNAIKNLSSPAPLSSPNLDITHPTSCPTCLLSSFSTMRRARRCLGP